MRGRLGAKTNERTVVLSLPLLKLAQHYRTPVWIFFPVGRSLMNAGVIVVCCMLRTDFIVGLILTILFAGCRRPSLEVSVGSECLVCPARRKFYRQGLF